MNRLVGLVVLVLVMAAGQGTAAGAKPDLVVKKLSATPMAAAPGGSVRVSDTVGNVGKGRAKAAAVGYLLSKDATRGKGDRAVSGRRAIKALRRGAAGRGSRLVTVPAAMPAGSYRLLACADPAGRISERSERNNCRAAAGTFRVRAVEPPPPPAPPALPGSPTPTPTPAQTPTPGTGSGSSAFPLPADPIKVGDTLETATRRTQTMYPGFENSMTVTGGDGTTYTLTMPQNALLSAIDVTMTPVDAVNGLPFAKGLVGAVQLEPHGLQLQKPATLTIDPPTDAPVAQQTAFLYHQGGHDFHLYPVGPERELTLRLMHFSTPGVGLASAAERAGVADNPPARPVAQLEQASSEGARQGRANGLGESAGPDAPAPPSPSAVFSSYYDGVVRPKLVAAETNDALARDAIAEANSWARNAELMGLENDPAYQKRLSEMKAKIEIVLRNAAEKAYERCVTDHDLEQIARLAGLARIEAVHGYDLGDVWDKFLRCTNFEVKFDSKITSTLAWSGGGGEGGLSGSHDALWRVGSTIPLDFTAVALNKPLTWKAFSYESVKNDDCGDNPDLVTREQGVSTVDGSVSAILSMDLNPREPAPEGQPAPDPPEDHVQFAFQNAPDETYQRWTQGCTSSAPTTDTQSRWWSHFQRFHTGRFPFRMDIARGAQLGALIDAQRWQQQKPINMGSLGGGADVEDTIVEIWHKPLP